MRFPIAAAGVCLALAVLAASGAEAETGSAKGVWKGRIGRAAIVACLDATSGEYYYEQFRTSIPLNASDSRDGSWTEGDADIVSGRWSVFEVEGDELLATWFSASDAKKLPIHLTRVAPLTQESCESGAEAAYEAPRRIATPRRQGPVFVSEVRDLLDDSNRAQSGPKIRRVSAALKDNALSVLQLDATDVAATKINASLRDWFDEALSRYYGCRNMGKQGSYELEADELAFADDRWLSVRRIDRWGCGGPYPGAEIRVETFDRRTGELVDPAGWVEMGDDPADAMRKRLLDHGFQDSEWEGNRESQAECQEAWETASFTVWPSRAGLAFSPSLPHVVQACESDIALPYEEIAPFLTAEGRAALDGRR